jgi:cell division GTPase FtsZ
MRRQGVIIVSIVGGEDMRLMKSTKRQPSANWSIRANIIWGSAFNDNLYR